MKFLPYDKFEIETTKAPEVIVESLKPKIDPRKLFRFSSDHAYFQGNISLNGFKLSRIIHYRNPCLPIILGRFLPKVSGTKVVIKMRLHVLITAFMSIWFGGVGLGCFLVLNYVFTGKKPISLLLFIPFLMLFIGWAMISGWFWFEAKKQKPMLVELFNDLDTDN